MASFDVGGAGMGARIMMLFEGRRAALFTAEGRPTRSASSVTHGPLSLTRDGDSIVLAFRGPAVIVPDATAYLSIERALASGRLDGAMEVKVRFEIESGGADADFDFDRILTSSADASQVVSSSAAFGRIVGNVCIGGIASEVAGYARAGISFTGLGPQKFIVRRMLWACFEGSGAPHALEARSVTSDDGSPAESARILSGDGWSPCELRDLSIHTASVEEPPKTIFASMANPDGSIFELEGRAECFIPLSRPGPEQSRIYTTLGFASFQSGTHRGAGMFEYSRRAESVMTSSDDDDSDAD